LDDVVNAFAGAPDDGFGPPRLHLYKGEDMQLHEDTTSFTDPDAPNGIAQLKLRYFGTPEERANLDKNWLLAKRLAFHYAVFIHSIENEETRSGKADSPGNDIIVSLGAWDVTRDNTAGTFMHELGHNLGLNHGNGLIGEVDLDSSEVIDPNEFAAINCLLNVTFCFC